MRLKFFSHFRTDWPQGRGGESDVNEKLSVEVSDTPLRLIRSRSGCSTFVNRVSVFYQRNINFFFSEAFFCLYTEAVNEQKKKPKKPKQRGKNIEKKLHRLPITINVGKCIAKLP